MDSRLKMFEGKPIATIADIEKDFDTWFDEILPDFGGFFIETDSGRKVMVIPKEEYDGYCDRH